MLRAIRGSPGIRANLHAEAANTIQDSIAMTTADHDRSEPPLTIGYHASHEQFDPAFLLTCARRAEEAGFKAAMNSDHFLPWSEAQGHSGFAWSWMGAAMQTSSMSMGVVCAPGYRYHPAVIAQASATLAQMFPGRFWIALGSGEALNEHITGERWPDHSERNARLEECVEVIRALYRGDTVTHRGRITVEHAKLYTRPKEPPLLVGAAITPSTAARVGRWADALITASASLEELEKVVRSFREGGGEGKPMFLQAKVAYGKDEDAIRKDAYEQWRTNVVPGPLLANLVLPEHFEAAASLVRPEDVEAKVRISADIERHVAWLKEYVELGFERIYVHNVARNQLEFITAFGERVLPALRS